jgi:hypothetical protein
MEDKLEFNIYRNDLTNIQELLKLNRTYYNDGDIINEDYLIWQYLDNPNGKAFLFTSKEKSDIELAGEYLVLPIKFWIDNNAVMGSLSLNTLTNPKYQGKGLFIKMAKYTYEACEKENAFFTIGFPNPQSYPGFVKKLDFQHLGDIPLLIKPLRPVKILLSYIKKNKKKHEGDIPINLPTHHSIKELDISIDARQYEKFWEKIRSNYTLSSYKDLAYMKWRYFDHPTRTYKVLAYKKNSDIEGIVVLRAENAWGFNVGLIMDIMILNDDAAVGAEILHFCKKIFSSSNIDLIAALHSPVNEWSILKNGGYFVLPQIMLPQKIHFIVRLNKDFINSKLLFNFSNWKLSFGDYDVF